MLSCISIGISDYEHSGLRQIPCAKSDAERVYDAFQAAMGTEFNRHLSVCAFNIRNYEFQTLLRIVSDVLAADSKTADPILVVYFSGHATLDNRQQFELQFPGYKGNGENTDDKFTADQFASLFRTPKKKKIKLLIILDCCCSGAALSIANNEDDGPEISILTSGSACESAEFDETGSKFTSVLCKSIDEIHRGGETFSLDTLVKKICSNGYPNAFVNRGAAQQVNLLFRSSPTDDGFDKYLPAVFTRKIRQNNMLSREAMWYSLNYLPNNRVYDTCEMYFDIDDKYGHKLASEASWLVRRAIGSTLANHISYKPILELLYRLLESNYWQEQCIALIGLRYLMRESSSICEHILNLVKAKKIQRIDAVWLVSLYAADNDHTDWTIFLNTVLAQSVWGMIEICKAYKLFNQGFEAQEFLCKHPSYEHLKAEKRRQTKDELSGLEKAVYGADTRGRLPENVQTKFLLSALYGNWRDQVSLNLTPYIEQCEKEQIMDELEKFRVVDNAERKMALFAFFAQEKKFSDFSDALKWGLNDEHPWVRRAAIEYFLDLSPHSGNIEECYFSTRFDNKYPGILDFYLTSPSGLHQRLIQHIKKNSLLLPGDVNSLDQSFSCE